MSDTRMSEAGISVFLEEDHQMTLDTLENLDMALLGLQFEGKSSRGKNLKQLRSILGFFQGRLMKHMEREEQVIFPFLESHVPKLASVIHLLEAEHEDFKKNLKGFRALLQEIFGGRNGMSRVNTINEIRKTGIYLIYLLRSHVRAESKAVYQILERELRPAEKKELVRQIAGCEKRGGSRCGAMT